MWVPPLPRRHDGLCRVLFMEVIIMVRQVKVSNFAEVQGIVSAAAKCYNEVGVHPDGLVHVSQISDKVIKNPRDALKVGDVVQVKVLSVDTAK